LKLILVGALLSTLFYFEAQASDKAALERGKRVYMSNCIQCHNRDPNLKGPIGPELVDSPLEVMTSKVMTGKYPNPLPAGFVPKRKTSAMRKLPKLQKDIPAIYAWIQSVKKKK
jgi:mono/diheme cytochrome c family protein